MSKQLEHLARTLRTCTCERPSRSAPKPSPRFEHIHFLSNGCHLQQEILFEAFSLALESGALGRSGLFEIPDFITTNTYAQSHLSTLLQELV